METLTNLPTEQTPNEEYTATVYEGLAGITDQVQISNSSLAHSGYAFQTVDCKSGTTLRLSLIVILVPVCVAGIAGNVLVLMALILNRRMRNIGSGFLANLVVCDLLQCHVVLPFLLYNLLNEKGADIDKVSTNGISKLKYQIVVYCLQEK